MLVGLRSRLTNAQSTLVGGRANLGFIVVTPFRMGQGTILVNRGWMPLSLRDSSGRKQSGPVIIEGIIRQGEPNQLIGVANKPEKNEWCQLDLDAMAEHAQSSRVLVEMTDCPLNQRQQKPEYPLLRIPDVKLPNNHLMYAITWLSLTIASSALILRGRRALARPI